MKDNNQEEKDLKQPVKPSQQTEETSGEIKPPWIEVEEHPVQKKPSPPKKETENQPLPTEFSDNNDTEKKDTSSSIPAPKDTLEKEKKEVKQENIQSEDFASAKKKKNKQPATSSENNFIKQSPFKKVTPIIVVAVIGIILFFVGFKVLPGLINKGKQLLTGEGGSDGGGVSAPGKTVDLVYWGLWEPEQVMSQLIAEYKKENPNVNIQYTQQSKEDYRERLQSALAKGEGPDIFRFHNTWVPMLKNDLDVAPNDVKESINLSTNYYPVVSKNLTTNQEIMGIPIYFDSLALYYNQELLEQANETPPSTWEDLRQLAVDLTVKDDTGKIHTAGVALGTTNNVEHWSDILGLMMLQNGANPAEPSSELSTDALKFYTIFAEKDKVWDETLPNSIYAFATGKVAMIFAPSWRAHQINEISEDLNYATVPVPQLPGEKIAWATYWAEGVWEKSKEKKEAWKFLEFMSTQKALNTFYSAASGMRRFGEPYPRVDMASQLQDDPIVYSFVKQGPYAESWYLCSRTFDNGINDRIIKYYENAVNGYLEGQEAKEVLTTAASGVKQVLSSYGIASPENTTAQ